MNLDFSKYHVLVIGDVMLDRYIHGSVDRISPEAPVPILGVEKRENRLGGAANVALNLKGLGAEVSVISIIGDDVAGKDLVSLFIENNIDVNLITDKSRPSTCKTRVMSSSQHLLRVDEESSENISPTIESKLLESLTTLIKNKNIDLVILQDYNKGVFTTTSIVKIINVLRDNTIKYAVDPKFVNSELYRDAFLFKPNLLEAKAISNKDNYSAIADEIKVMLNAKNVVLTLAAEGMYCVSDEGGYHVKTMSKDIVDVCGAGDTVIATLSLALLEGFSLELATRLANRAAGIVCQKSGVAPIYKEDLVE